MEAMKLSGLKPQNVFYFFEKLCAIPHGSGNTKAISDYLAEFAKEHNLRHIQDQLNNVIIFAPASPGYEDHEAVIIQGHMDMVCEKDADCLLDMEKDGLDVMHDGEYVFAKGTTLGGDDGIAVAYALAILADSTIAHPALEVVVTVDEETGMDGAAGIDLSCLKGRKLLNIDSEEEGILTVSCAGGAKSTVALPLARRAVYGPCIKLVVENLQGGHSGVEIHKRLANANKMMGVLLHRVRELMPLCLTKLEGGAKDNAIPRSCEATMVAMGMNLERINGICDALQQEIRSNFDEPEAIVRGEDVDALGGNALSAEDTDRVIKLLNEAPNGVQSWSEDIPGLVQTSLNLGIMNLTDSFRMTFAVRSSVNTEKEALLKALADLAGSYRGEYTQRGEYPAWEYKKDSQLRDTMVNTYEKLYGKKPQVVAIHAGLECGLLGEKLPGLDCVSFGPDMKDIHTSREKLNIASTERTWNYLLEVLKAL